MEAKNKWKLFGKITVADIVIIIVLLAAAGGVLYKIKTPKPVKLDNVRMEFYVECVPSYAAQNVNTGDKIIDSEDSNQLGNVVDKLIDAAAVYKPNSEGKYVKSPQEGYNSIVVIAEMPAKYAKNSFKSNGKEYNLGKTYGLKIGDELFYGRIRSVEKK